MWKMLCQIIYLILVSIIGRDSVNSSTCDLETDMELLSYSKQGDLILGGIMQMAIFKLYEDFALTRKPSILCAVYSIRYFRHFMAFVFAVEEINKQSKLLPNITLGFQIYDSCLMENKAIESALSILTGAVKAIPNYSCNFNSKVVAFIGHMMSSSTYSLAGLTGIYRYPQISYGAMDPIFNDRIQFPSLYRTVPNERIQYKAIIQLLQHFGWNWVGIITSDDESNYRVGRELRDEIINSGSCVEFLITVLAEDWYNKHLDVVLKSSCKVVIVYTNPARLISILLYSSRVSGLGKVLILPATLLTFPELHELYGIEQLSGTLRFSVQRGDIPGLRDFLQSADPYKYPDNIFLKYIWARTFRCLPQNMTLFPDPYETIIPVPECEDNRDLSVLDPSMYDVNNFRFTHSVYTAVYSVAHALHDICLPGYRKAQQEGRPRCCYDCVQCTEGEISNSTDMENCLKCPEDHWPNIRRDNCIPRMIDFLSYEEPLGGGIAVLAVSFSAVTVAVLGGDLIKNKDTPVVTCLLRQVAFGIIFTVAVSCVLSKTITVVIAFNAMKPDSKLRRWVGSRVSSCLVFLCSLGEVVICIVWLIHSPPFQDYDTQSEYITFSMLVFCSVWVSFIPAYLSTKGKYMVAVEVFAILASGAGLLCCIFIPKCYIILMRPELNTKAHLTIKMDAQSGGVPYKGA
ncbi:hypothetical protein FKM82_010080 [Ascaphus truei]